MQEFERQHHLLHRAPQLLAPRQLANAVRKICGLESKAFFSLHYCLCIRVIVCGVGGRGQVVLFFEMIFISHHPTSSQLTTFFCFILFLFYRSSYLSHNPLPGLPDDLFTDLVNLQELCVGLGGGAVR